MGEEDGTFRLGVALPCDDAASLCSCAAAASGGLEGNA